MIPNNGKGLDRKGTRVDGLRWEWKWLEQRMMSSRPENDHRRLPCQACIAEIEVPSGWWQFEVIYWNTDYEAQVRHDGEQFAAQEGLPTRLEAQRRAEMLVKEFCEAAIRDLYGDG